MSVDRNAATARRFFEDGWNRRDYTVFNEVLAPNWVYYGYSAASAGKGGLKERLGPRFTAFPDYHVTIEDLIAEGDKVVVRYTARGTHRGVFLGTAPTGKAIVYQSSTRGRYSPVRRRSGCGTLELPRPRNSPTVVVSRLSAERQRT
jgi:predicted ester cyclase